MDHQLRFGEDCLACSIEEPANVIVGWPMLSRATKPPARPMLRGSKNSKRLLACLTNHRR
jgi:hypothetical protein